MTVVEKNNNKGYKLEATNRQAANQIIAPTHLVRDRVKTYVRSSAFRRKFVIRPNEQDTSFRLKAELRTYVFIQSSVRGGSLKLQPIRKGSGR